mmetsp:Transcript_54792/g.97512  ORF Transcript_54792/g.97512 Transcript_54792/m.97512 type:complete len:269 (+) Transcript_54792:706-1512(+)
MVAMWSRRSLKCHCSSVIPSCRACSVREATVEASGRSTNSRLFISWEVDCRTLRMRMSWPFGLVGPRSSSSFWTFSSCSRNRFMIGNKRSTSLSMIMCSSQWLSVKRSLELGIRIRALHCSTVFVGELKKLRRAPVLSTVTPFTTAVSPCRTRLTWFISSRRTASPSSSSELSVSSLSGSTRLTLWNRTTSSLVPSVSTFDRSASFKISSTNRGCTLYASRMGRVREFCVPVTLTHRREFLRRGRVFRDRQDLGVFRHRWMGGSDRSF